VRPRQHSKGLGQPQQILAQLGRERGADLAERRADRVVEDGALEHAQQVGAEGERQDLVGREGRIAQPERLQEAVEHAAVALLGDHREARVLERVQVAVDRAPHTAERLGQVVEVRAPAAARQSLDQLPLARELVASHRASR
jgi:hypothetical protein